MKRVAAIHDISGFGKCSLTVALPIISAAGIEVCAMPTAVLSTHTGGIEGFTYRDLTEDLRPFARHWKSLGLRFDAVYTGFLGSFEQLEIVGEFIGDFKTADNIVLVDPVMADHGELYKVFTPDFVDGMRNLCKKADIIAPNITEACFLVGEEYHDGPYTEKYIETLVTKLSDIGPSRIVLTGVFFDEDKLGAATFDRRTGKLSVVLSDRIPGYYHGTGDVFGSALIAGLMKGFSLHDATEIAVDFTTESIRRTEKAGTDRRFGVNFEESIPTLLERTKNLENGE